MKRGKNPETAITKQIRWVLGLLKIPHTKIWSGPFSECGTPDIVGTLPPSGRSLYLEVKTPTGRVSEEQQAFLDKMRAAGAVAFVARGPHEAIAALAEAGFEPAKRIKIQFRGRPET